MWLRVIRDTKKEKNNKEVRRTIETEEILWREKKKMKKDVEKMRKIARIEEEGKVERNFST